MYYVWRFVCLFFCSVNSENGPDLGSFPTYKTWWAKEIINQNIYTAGRLTETQIKYTHEMGFKSMIGMFNYETASKIGEEILPKGEDEKLLATEVVGLKFVHILAPGEQWKQLETVRRFGQAYNSLPKPLLYHCSSAYSATATTLMYFLNTTKHNPNAEPRVTLDEFFRIASAHGYDYGSDVPLLGLLKDIMGVDEIEVTARPNVTMPKWNSKYWLTHPIHDNWYAAGQIRSNYKEMIKNFDAIVNLREGVVSNSGKPSQGEVTLLNVKDDTGTYTGTGRQSKAELEKNRVDPTRPNNYISPDSTANYQQQNGLEYGDSIGYNSDNEKNAIALENIPYHHLPLENGADPLAYWRKHKTVFQQLGQSNDAILIHSRNGEHAVFLGLLSVGCQHGHGSDWAQEKGKSMGFHWSLQTHPEMIATFKTVLDNQATEC